MIRHRTATCATVLAAVLLVASLGRPTTHPPRSQATSGPLVASQAQPWPVLPVRVSALKSGGAVEADLRLSKLERAQWEASVVAWQMAETLGRVKAEEQARPASIGSRGPTSDQHEPGNGRCGGDLPPCSVMFCESGGNLRAQNPRSSASGKWQVIDSTWRTEDTNGDGKADSFGGYARAMDAPEAVQDERARQLYAGGRGRRHWVC